jgi:hypothetical protein
MYTILEALNSCLPLLLRLSTVVEYCILAILLYDLGEQFYALLLVGKYDDGWLLRTEEVQELLLLVGLGDHFNTLLDILLTTTGFAYADETECS